jgi:AbrB family looped-hinge helix DNA binding protein
MIVVAGLKISVMSVHNPLLEYVTTTKLGGKGQLTVPKQIRDDLGWGSVAPVAILRLGDGLILLPQQHCFEHFFANR